MLKKIKNEISILLSKTTSISENKIFASLEIPKNNVGDLSSKIAFGLAKEQKKSPIEIAKEIVAKIPEHKYIERTVAVGPYINFFFSHAYFNEIAKEIAKNPDYGKQDGKNEKIIVEFPSVNPNKPWHIGHLRNALLGDSIARILSFSGKRVETMDYIDDLGLQVAQSFYGYLNSTKNPDKKLDHWIGEQYVHIASEIEKNPQIDKKIRDLLKKIEHGNNEIAEKARKLSEDVVKAQYETNFALGIYHDVLIFESDITRTIFNKGMKKLKTSNAIHLEKEGKNAGCLVIQLGEKFKEMKNDQKVLIRSDGTATYIGKDVIFQLWKFGLLSDNFEVYSDFIKQPNGKIAYKTSSKGEKMQFGKADVVINIIGTEQSYPQEVIKETFSALGYVKEAQNFIHLAYEHAVLPKGKFSGRKGTWIRYTTDEFIAEAKSRALEKITKEMSEIDKQETAETVGIAAIKFSFLKTSPEKKIIFDWDIALSFEGDSGPYLQYAYVRALGILSKWNGEINSLFASEEYNNEEKMLLNQISIFSEVVERAAMDLRPHYIADYTLKLATLFNKFYTKNQVLNAEEKDKIKRLTIVAACTNTLRNALYLLGITAPKQM